MLYILDYGAGNVASLANSVRTLGYEFKWIESVEDIEKAGKILFPGVGAFESALASLRLKGYSEPLKKFIASGRPYMGICIGMQALFESSAESTEGEKGLGVVPARVEKFSIGDRVVKGGKKTVPCIGWNGATRTREGGEKWGFDEDESYYFVHSFRVGYEEKLKEWALTLTQYGDEVYVSSIQKDNVFATQCHPEKSGKAGLEVLKAWLEIPEGPIETKGVATKQRSEEEVRGEMKKNGFKKRIVACLDVRANDDGDLVVTKGDQYDVRESEPLIALADATSSTTQPTSSTNNDTTTAPSLNPSPPTKRQVRNLGKPVALAQKYYASGADEVCFLNITSFRSCPLHDQPMLDVVRKSSETVFVPLTIGGGIRDTVDPDGTKRSALEVAGTYFRNGADKISIGGDAVDAVLELQRNGGTPTGKSSIETISKAYGAQAVVVSIDPKRHYATSLDEIEEVHRSSAVDLAGPLKSGKAARDDLGPKGERYCWYQCTVKGGRELSSLDVVQLAQGVEPLGAGELLLNSVDRDGQKNGFDLRLVELVKSAVGIPVVASSGAGKVEDFEEVFEETGCEAALAAGIFHREEVGIMDVKDYLKDQGTLVRK